MTDVSRQNQGAFYQGKNQGQDDHGRHVAEEIPQLAFDVVKRRKRYHGGDDRGKHRRQDLQRPVDGGLHSRGPAFIMLVDVLRDDDAIVHQNADDEDHPKEGNHVDGHAHVPRKQEHPHERHRNRQSHPERQADVEEQRQKQHHEDEPDDAVVHQQIDALVEHGTRIADDLDACVALACVVGSDVAADIVGDVQNGFRRQVVDGDHCGRFAVEPTTRRVVLRPALADVGNIAEPHHPAIGIRPQDDVVKSAGLVLPETPADDDFFVGCFEATARGFEVGIAHGGGYLRNGQVEFVQIALPQAHLYFFIWEATEQDLRDALNGPQF